MSYSLSRDFLRPGSIVTEAVVVSRDAGGLFAYRE